jgi:hypothetical protein
MLPHAESDFGAVLELLYVPPWDGHVPFPGLVLRMGRNAALEGAQRRRGRFRRHLRLRGDRRDAELLQAFALPVVKGRPDLRLALLGQPFPDVHAVDGEPGQHLGLTGLSVFVGRTFPSA